jgi:FAD/FMN-containing dehydrogenase
MNVGFSSTTGVQIAMSELNDIVLSPDSTTIDIGAGCLWDDVYAALNGTGVNVVGGRVSGVGMAGFTLGGGERQQYIYEKSEVPHIYPCTIGYSWKTNQHGLSADNAVGYQLVLPNGTITNVSADENQDLFFALRVRPCLASLPLC